MSYILTSDGLGKNAMQYEEGRGGYFPTNSGTTETQALLIRGALRAYAATGVTTYLDNARKYADALIKYYFFETEAPTTGLWPCQWIVNAGDTFYTKGPVSSVSSQLNGSVGTVVAFVSGLATIADLATVYRAFSSDGTLTWSNVFAEVSTGTEYTIDSYYDKSGNKFTLSGTTSTFTGTTVPSKAGQVQLAGAQATLTGNAKLNYSIYTATAVPFGTNFECWPMWRSMDEGEWNCAADSLHWLYDAFELLITHDATQTARWARSRDAILRMWTECLTWDTGLYVCKKTADATAAYNNDPLTFYITEQSGVEYVTPNVPSSPVGYVRTTRDSNGYISTVLPLDAARTKFRWANESIYINGIFTADTDCLKLAIGSSGAQASRVILTDSNGYTYQCRYVFGPGTVPTNITSIPLSWFNAGYSWNTGAISYWGDGSGYHGSLQNGSDGFGFPLSPSVPSITLTYTTANTTVQYRVTDSGGQRAAVTLAVGTHTIIITATSGNIVNLDFLNNAETPVAIVIGSISGVHTLVSGIKIRKVWIDFESTAASTIKIGDVYFSGAPTRETVAYSGGGLPFQLSSNSPRGSTAGLTAANFQGPYYMGYQNPVPFIGLNDYTNAEIMMNMMIAAQAAYLTSTGVTGPVAPVYIPLTWDSIMFGTADTFCWTGPDPNTFWGGFQYRAFAAVADFWQQCVAAPVSNGAVTKAATFTNSFLTWLDTWLTENPTEVMIPSTFNAAVEPTVVYSDPQMISLALKGAIFAKKAGADSAVCKRVISSLYALLVNFNITGGDMDGSFTPDPTGGVFYGYWAGELLDTLALYILNPT
jgi:hypothetical protein